VDKKVARRWEVRKEVRKEGRCETQSLIRQNRGKQLSYPAIGIKTQKEAVHQS
jgi:hypothetical protein